MEEINLKKIIVDELKKEGKDIAEDAVASVVKALFKAVPKVVLATENKIDDLLVPMLGIIEPKVLEFVDKIDGEVG